MPAVRQDMVSPHTGEAEALPYLQNHRAEPRAKNLLSSVSDYMGRMRQEAAKSNQHTITNSAIKEH